MMLQACTHVQCFVFLAMCLLRGTVGDGKFLHYATQGEKEIDNGIWGGEIDDVNDGRAQDLRQTGFYCQDMKKGTFYSGLDIESVSHDPMTGRAVIKLDEKTRTSTSAIITPVCTSSPSCSIPTESKVLFYQAENKDNKDGIQSAKIGPMAFYNSTLYFVVQRFSKGPNGPSSRLHRIEIRKLIKCNQDFPFTASHKFDIDVCSDFVALVTEEIGDNIIIEMRETQQPADHLKIVPLDNELVFLVQIKNLTHDEYRDIVGYSLDLMTTSAYSPGSTRLLHRQRVPLDFTYYHFMQLGGIDYKDGVLCWTTVNRVRCARWDGKLSLKNSRTVLHNGQAARVCYAPYEDTEKQQVVRNVTTGLAISEVNSRGVTFYFGCHAGKKNIGGAGFVRLSADWKSFELDQVMDNSGPIFAGSMFMTSSCDHMMSDGHVQEAGQHSNTGQEQQADSHGTEVVIVAEKSQSNSASVPMSLNVLYCLTFLLCLLRMSP